MDRLSDLPEPILHRIIYFLIDEKEAARTCILSKSWRSVCSDRPKLSLSERTFNGNKKDFLFQANNTLQSLLDQNHQGIEEFHLTISTLDSQSLAFLQKWIPMLTAISIKHLSLHIIPDNNEEDGVDLPFQAFAAESLQKLHLCRCNLLQDHITIQPFKHHLTTLRLRHVSVKEDQSIVDEIISSCPLLTTMWFEECKGLRNIKLMHKFHKSLRHFTFIRHKSYTIIADCNIEIDLPTLETIKIDGSRVHFHNSEYSKLKSLSLKTVRISRNSFHRSSLCRCPSLEYLRIIYYSGGLLCIDAPNIAKFEYLDYHIPSVFFKATCGKWRSTITLSLDRFGDGQSWFLRLSKLLHSLTQSETCLRILNMHIQEDPPALENIDIGNDKPVLVESLGLGGNVPCFPALLKGLFCICHPRYIAQHWYFSSRNEMMRMEHKELTEFLCKILINTNQQEEIGQHHLLPSEVKIQSFDIDRGEWQFTEQNSFTQFASTNSETFRKTRFLLKWSQDC